MGIPSNLIPFNTSVESLTPSVSPTLPINGVPRNLLPVNTSTIESSLESIAGQLPQINAPEISSFPVLNAVLPDSLFTTGSIIQIRDRTVTVAKNYLSGLPLPRIIPTISIPGTGTLPTFPPKRPSFAQIKNYIETKIDRIKRQRQKASIKALKDDLKKQENPFTQRQALKNVYQNNINVADSVLGRFNNQ